MENSKMTNVVTPWGKILDSMVSIAHQYKFNDKEGRYIGENGEVRYKLADVIDAFECGRKFTVPKALVKYYDAAVAEAAREELIIKAKELQNDPELQEFERLKAKFAPLTKAKEQ